ncbi:MAG: SDR family NAD(P)-dependent oxidoreductase [Clostridiaceae bacterium]|nr:SDR family NAD(P)-dependent oxidoreductase [Clostridiaceae bacterium]
METVLVTGGAGFIGSHLCERLVKVGYNVVNLDNFNDFYDPTIKYSNIQSVINDSHYKLVKGDIRDTNTLRKIFDNYKIGKIVHLAALAGVRGSIEKPCQYADVDIIGTVNLLNFAAKHRVDKFIFASSSSVYGNSPNIPFKEDDPLLLQVSPYAASKRSAELFCGTYSSLYNIPMVILRFFTVYGPRQRPEMAISLYTRLIDEGMEVPVYGDGTSKRDYTYIDDILDGIMAALNIKCKYEIFNLGNGHPVQLNEMLGIIEQKLGKKAMRKYLPMQLGDVDITCADISKSRDMLSYYPKVSLEEGIERYVKWYKNNKQG